MLKFVIFVVAITATVKNIQGELEAKYYLEENKMLEGKHWSEEKIEKQMRMFGVLINEQGKKMESAENEINNLKATIQRQEREMNHMENKVKLMEKKMEKYETTVNEQAERLNDKEKVIQHLERTVANQDIKIASIIEEMFIRKANFQREDTQIKVQENIKRNLNNKHQEGKMGKAKIKGNRKPDLVTTSFKNKSGKQSKYFSYLNTESDTDVSDSKTDKVTAANNNEYKNKSITEAISIWHQSPTKQVRQIGRGIAFSAYLTQELGSLNSGYTIKCDQVLLNDGNAYSPYTGAFTVPETGVYLLTMSINAFHNGHKNHVKLVSNNRNIVDAIVWVVDSDHHVMGGNTAIVRLNSGEKIWLEIYSNGGSELYSKGDYRWVTFSGVLLYS